MFLEYILSKFRQIPSRYSFLENLFFARVVFAEVTVHSCFSQVHSSSEKFWKAQMKVNWEASTLLFVNFVKFFRRAIIKKPQSGCLCTFLKIKSVTHIFQETFPVSSSLQTCKFSKKRLQHRCFPVNITKFLRAPILKNICRWLLLLLSEIIVLFLLLFISY